MMRTVVVLTVTSLVVAASVRPSDAREHQQIMAEIRMLQEQTQQLQLALSKLSQTLEAVGKQIDTQTETTRRSFADQKLLADNLADDVRVVRERLNDNNVRLGALSQELDAVRHSVVAGARVAPPPGGTPPAGTFPTDETPSAGVSPSSEAPVPVEPEADPGAEPEAEPDAGPEAPEEVPLETGVESEGPTPGEAPVDLGGADPAEASRPPIPPGASPTRMYDSAFADYASGQWALAIAGFDSFLRTFPQSDLADDAQFLIGEAYAMDEKLSDAVSAYDEVITTHADGDKVPDALYKKGIALSRLGDAGGAREAFETLIDTHPQSEAAALARQVLDGIARRQ